MGHHHGGAVEGGQRRRDAGDEHGVALGPLARRPVAPAVAVARHRRSADRQQRAAETVVDRVHPARRHDRADRVEGLVQPHAQIVLHAVVPLGLAGVFVVSRGEKTPWRLKLRTPSFNNVSALEAVLVGVRTRDVELALASIGYVVGDIDR